MKKFMVLSSALILTGCVSADSVFPVLQGPEFWRGEKTTGVEIVTPDALQHWWLNFGDADLNMLVDKALEGNPDRRIAAARIAEARGLRRSAFAQLTPQFGFSASKGRDKTQQSEAGDFYDAQFDASYEIDLFGKNRSNLKASEASIEAAMADYENVSLSLIAEVTRTYIDMRANQKQAAIARKNLEIQEKTLVLIRQLKNSGENPQLDVERSETLVNTTQASIPQFERLAENARLRLDVLTGQIPGTLSILRYPEAKIPGSEVDPVLLAPAELLALRPDIRAAAANLAMRSHLTDYTIASIFPTISIGGFFGVAESALADSTSIWNIALGAALSKLNFGRVEGQINAAKAREVQAYELYRKTVLEAVLDVETALNDYAKGNDRLVSLTQAYINADNAFSLSQDLFNEGEISFIDILDAQRTLNAAQSAMVEAEAAQVQALIALYKAMGVGL